MRAVRKIGEVGDAGRKPKPPTHKGSGDTPLSPINFFKINKIKNKYFFPFLFSNFGTCVGEGGRYGRIGAKVPSDGGCEPHIYMGRYPLVRQTASN